jgi:hypothetical protein
MTAHMPQRYITVPESKVLINPQTKEPLKDSEGKNEAPMTFKNFIQRLMFNPKWTESYQNIRTADAITKAVDKLEDGKVLVLAEEDWAKLDDAAQNPKQIIVTPFGPQAQPGYGYHPTIAPQLLPFIEAIVEAKKEPPAQEG